jgi:transposase
MYPCILKFSLYYYWNTTYYWTMYIDVVPNRHSPPAILLRESVRDGATIRKRTLANLSQWEPARIDALRRALRGDFDHLPLGEPTCGPVFGVLYALKQVADDLGITGTLGHTRTGKLALFLTLARVAHQGSRLSAVRWAQQHAVSEVLGLSHFDEDDLYATLDALAQRQERLEQRLYRRYVARRGSKPLLFLYDVTSSYLEGAQNALAAYGYNRDGKRGKPQIVLGLLTDEAGEPLAVRVFEGNTADPTTVPTQLTILKERFRVDDVVFVGDGGLVKAKGKAALSAAGLRYLTALSDPQVRRLLKRDVLQLELFAEQVCEVQADGTRYILRKNEAEARQARHRLDNKLTTLQALVATRNTRVAAAPRCQPEAGLRVLQTWVKRYKLSHIVALGLDERQLTLTIDTAAYEQALQLAGCYVLETDVPATLLDTQTAHDRYKALACVEQDLRTLKTGLLEVRPIFVRKDTRTRGHVFVCLLALKLSRELQRRVAATYGTTKEDPHGVTLHDALDTLHRLCLLTYPLDDTHNITRLPRPDAQQTRLLQALQVSLPSRGACRQ